METAALKNFIDESLKQGDASLLKRLVEVIENYNNDKSPSPLTPKQKKTLDQIAKRHETGESPSHLWEDIKQELREDHDLQA
jgi:transposase